MKRLAQINEDGTLEIGGIRCKVVPVEPTKLMLDRARLHNATYHKWDSMLAAAIIDLSGLPGVPERVTPGDAWDGGWNAALDAIGVK